MWSSVSHLRKDIPPGREANGLMLVQTVKCRVLGYDLPALPGLSQLFHFLPGLHPAWEGTEGLTGAWGQEAELNLLRL